jgi:hypothetical protein
MCRTRWAQIFRGGIKDLLISETNGSKITNATRIDRALWSWSTYVFRGDSFEMILGSLKASIKWTEDLTDTLSWLDIRCFVHRRTFIIGVSLDCIENRLLGCINLNGFCGEPVWVWLVKHTTKSGEQASTIRLCKGLNILPIWSDL